MQIKLETQAEAVIYYIQEMDIDMLDLILDKEKEYQDVSKDVFIQNLNTTFDVFRFNNNDKLIKHKGFCNSDKCANSCKNGYAFAGNHSKHILNIIFEVKNGIIQDMYECFDFKIFNRELNMENYTQLTLSNLEGDEVNGITSPF